MRAASQAGKAFDFRRLRRRQRRIDHDRDLAGLFPPLTSPLQRAHDPSFKIPALSPNGLGS
jgi:hypothetical protein